MDKFKGTGEQTMNEYKNKMYKQAEHFGLENRMLQCTEECGELIQALSKYKRTLQGDKTCKMKRSQAINMVLEEIADVEITLKQLKYLLCKTEAVEHIKVRKVIRTEKRILEPKEQEQTQAQYEHFKDRFLNVE
mgnify:CR=1 FL=1|jgi:NTP pyrophosphatase (non-canonical NTP hydrolase)